MNIRRSFRKGFITKEKLDYFMEKYTVLIKGNYAYQKFLLLQKPKT